MTLAASMVLPPPKRNDNVALLITGDLRAAGNRCDSRVGLDAGAFGHRNAGGLQARNRAVERAAALDAAATGDEQGLFTMLTHHFAQLRERSGTEDEMCRIVKFKFHGIPLVQRSFEIYSYFGPSSLLIIISYL